MWSEFSPLAISEYGNPTVEALSKTHGLAGMPVSFTSNVLPLEDATVNFLSLLPLTWEQKHGPNRFPQTITTKKGAVWENCAAEKIQWWGIILASTSNVSQGKKLFSSMIAWSIRWTKQNKNLQTKLREHWLLSRGNGRNAGNELQ